jgi:beta-phosphoglucomutase family hydrolase
MERSDDHSWFSWLDFDGVLFDLDGVITPTAEIHESAWAELFRGEGFADYSHGDYLAFIDGRPRYDGVRAFLASRGVTLPEGSPTDAPGSETVCALGNRKNALFNVVLDRDGISPYPGSQATLDFLAAHAVPAGVVSSSKNALPVLAAAGLAARFEVVIDGLVAVAESIAGKPAPDTYLLGAQRLGLDPRRAVVVEDAVSGVAAGAAGGFAVVVGVNRGAGAETLLAHGATFVVDDLSDIAMSWPNDSGAQ